MTLLLEELDERWNIACETLKSILKNHWVTTENIDYFSNFLKSLQNQYTVIGLAGPGASGKTTILNKLKLEYGFHHLLNVTTRQARDNEQNGTDYCFLTENEFKECLENKKFFSTVEKSGRGNYGIYQRDFNNVVNGIYKKITLIESPLVLSNFYNTLIKKSEFLHSCIIIYLLPNKPIINTLVRHLSNRQRNICVEEIAINFGWRQIEEFSSLISLDKRIQLFVVEGLAPKNLSELIGNLT